MPSNEDEMKNELQKLDDLTESFFPRACAGDSRSAQIIIDVSERRAKLLGLDSPAKASLEVINYDSSELVRQYEILKRAANGS